MHSLSIASAAGRALALGLVVALLPRPAQADPQWSVALTGAVGARDLRDEVRPVVQLGGWADVLFLRQRNNQMALGPYVNLLTGSFRSFEAGGGVSWLLPVGGPVFILSAGPHLRVGDGSTLPGLTGNLFFGSRSFNFHSSYGYSLGIYAQGRHGLGDSRQAELTGGVQADVMVLALPFLLLANAFR